VTKTIRNWQSRGLFLGVLAAAALTMTPVSAQSVAVRQVTERVRNALEGLPHYGVFDFVAFELDQGSVMLTGYAYHGALKSDASKAIKDLDGIDEIGNSIEVLPASQSDDQIRWATFYRIYTDPFLSRYAPGGAPNARAEAIRYSRYPGLQPLGSYPIHIVVKHGRTTLVGVVDNEADKIVAGVRARDIPGVFEVKNELEVAND
jgi:hyperosmotically inducible periplasmic protein